MVLNLRAAAAVALVLSCAEPAAAEPPAPRADWTVVTPAELSAGVESARFAGAAEENHLAGAGVIFHRGVVPGFECRRIDRPDYPRLLLPSSGCAWADRKHPHPVDYRALS